MVSSKEKIGIIIASILIFILIIYNFSWTGSAETANPVSTSFFSSSGVSFEYPSTWTISTQKSGDDTIISGVKNEFSLFGVAPLTVQITPNYGISEEGLKKQMENTVPGDGWSKVSNSTTIIDGKTAYVEVYEVNSIWPPVWNNKLEIITLAKDNNTYTILLQASKDKFDEEHFEIILNSFKIDYVLGGI